ncbi:hypothetical protein Tco_0531386 [Tanacetum coccineum]
MLPHLAPPLTCCIFTISPYPSPLTTSPTNAGAPLGYRADGIRMRAAAALPPSLLPSTSPRTDVPEAEMPPQKRDCLTTPATGCEIGESSVAGATRQPRPTPEVDTWDEISTEILRYDFEEADDYRGTSSEERSAAIEAHVRTLEAQVATLIAQTASLQTQLTTVLGRIATLEAREPEPQDRPAEAGSSS